jgi:hypothetical protein
MFLDDILDFVYQCPHALKLPTTLSYLSYQENLGHKASLSITIRINLRVHSVLQARLGAGGNSTLTRRTRAVESRSSQSRVTLAHAFAESIASRFGRGSSSGSGDAVHVTSSSSALGDAVSVTISHARIASSTGSAEAVAASSAKG